MSISMTVSAHTIAKGKVSQVSSSGVDVGGGGRNGMESSAAVELAIASGRKFSGTVTNSPSGCSSRLSASLRRQDSRRREFNQL